MKANVISVNNDIHIGIINTFSQPGRSDLFRGIGMLVIDECHKLGAETFRNIFNNAKGVERILGLSATPDRMDVKHEIYFNNFDYVVRKNFKLTQDVNL